MSMDRLAATPGAPPQQRIEPQQKVGQQQIEDVQGASQVASPPPVVPPPPLQHQDSLQSGNLDVLLDDKAIEAFEMADVQSQYAVPDDDTQHEIEVVLDKGIKKVDDAHKALESQPEVPLEGVDPLDHDSDHLPDGLEGAFAKAQRQLTAAATPGERPDVESLKQAFAQLREQLGELQDSDALQQPKIQEALQAQISQLNEMIDGFADRPGFQAMLDDAQAGRLPSVEDMQGMHDAAKEVMAELEQEEQEQQEPAPHGLPQA